MIISKTNLDALRTGFKTTFQKGLKGADTNWEAIATLINSSTKIETYGFLKEWPLFRRWVGEKRIKSLEEMEYRLANEDFEATIGIHKNKIRDDNLGLYGPLVEGWGKTAGELRGRLVFDALLAGHTKPCFDGQNFFDDEHEVAGEAVANMSGNDAVEPYFFLDLSQPLKPIILQERQAPEFTMVTSPEDSHVFATGEFLMGGEARYGAGYTYWQMAHRCTAAPSEAAFEVAKQAMASLTDDEGAKLEVRPTHVVTGSSNAAALKTLFKKQNKAGGESNIYDGEVIIIESKRLA